VLAVKDLPSPNFDARRGPPDMLVLHYTGMKSADEAVARLRARMKEWTQNP
jgi:N-acetylmuramoyl-L-alanine amidase